MPDDEYLTPPPQCPLEAAAAAMLEEIGRLMARPQQIQGFGNRAWLGAEGSSIRIYVRTGPRYIAQGLGAHQFVTLANIAVHPALQGQGLFTSLLEGLKQEVAPGGYGLYVESIGSPRFARFLTRQGFRPREHAEFDQYWLPAQSQD